MRTFNNYKSLFQTVPATPRHPVPDHQEVKPDEEAEHAAAVGHQVAEGEGLLLPQNLDRGRGEHRDQHRVAVIRVDNGSLGHLEHLTLVCVVWSKYNWKITLHNIGVTA